MKCEQISVHSALAVIGLVIYLLGHSVVIRRTSPLLYIQGLWTPELIIFY